MIKWAGQEYSVRTTIEPIGGEAGERSFLGKTDEADNTIVIDGTMPKTRQEEVFLHELIHIIAPSIPEFAVNEIGIGMFGILRENGLIKKNLLDAVDGEITQAEQAVLNRRSNERAEEMSEGFFKEAL